MRITFRDFYNQYVEIHNETGSGNVRIKINTLSNLNQVGLSKREDCTLEAEIALSPDQVDLVINLLKNMVQ